ncbi:MAG TPA: VOC family protein [Saprospiraceae bacterium]|nr:VOC family protein [Saprospiraceae bacterium]
MEKIPSNRVTWFQIPADDTERAWIFYGKVFGWTEEEVWKNEKFNGAILGSIESRSEQLKHPRLIILVDDIDKSIDTILASGGKLVETKTEIPEINMVYAVFEDTEGNHVNIVGDMAKDAK